MKRSPRIVVRQPNFSFRFLSPEWDVAGDEAAPGCDTHPDEEDVAPGNPQLIAPRRARARP